MAKAFGTKLQMTIATVLTDIAKVTNVKPYSKKVDIIDNSSHDSTEEWREKLAGMKDAGEVQLDLNYDPAATTHKALEDALDAGTAIVFAIKFANAPTGRVTGTFSGIVKGLDVGAPFDSKYSGNVVIEISGKIAWA